VLSGVANCLYGLNAAQQSGALALLTNLQARTLGGCSSFAG